MSALQDLVDIVARLRDPDGCPWDRTQDVATMRPYLLEEAHELLAAMDALASKPAQQDQPLVLVDTLREELGDLLFVLALVARIAQERGWFSLEEAAAGICRKMVVRHPHVFGEDAQQRARAQGGAPGSLAAWEARKAGTMDAQGPPRSRLAGVPDTLPGLLRAHRQGEKAAAAGFSWPDHRAVLAKVHEELAELEEALALHPPVRVPGAETPAAAHPHVEHELGDLLMATAELGRHVGAPPEAALRRANDRFKARFQEVERLAHARGRALTELDEAALDALWEQAKATLQDKG